MKSALCGWIAAATLMTTTTHAYGGVKACELIPDTDVSRTLLSTFQRAMRGNTDSLSICLLTGEHDRTVSILLRRNIADRWVAGQIDRMNSGRPFRIVTDLRHTAFLFDRGSNGATVCVFGPAYYLQISASHLGNADAVTPSLTALARTALETLDVPDVLAAKNAAAR